MMDTTESRDIVPEYDPNSSSTSNSNNTPTGKNGHAANITDTGENEKPSGAEDDAVSVSTTVAQAELHALMSPNRILKNVFVISLVFFLIFAAYGGLSRLQSSLHRDEGLGVICSAVVYGTMVIACLFLPKLAVTYLGHKWCMTISLLGYILWMAANGYAVWATMVPASIILGIAATTLWTPQCSYFTIAAEHYGKQKGIESDAALTRFFGIFFFFFQLSALVGATISSTILAEDPGENYTDPTDEELEMCGLSDCPWHNSTNENYEETDESLIWTLVVVYIAIGICAFILSALCVDPLPSAWVENARGKEKISKIIKDDLVATIRCMRHIELLLLIPLTMYSGFFQTFYGAEWNNSYVTCAIGIWMVGWTTWPQAIFDSLSSWCSGMAVKKTGRIPIFLIGFFVDVCYQVLLYTWSPHPDQMWLFYIIPALYGIADGIWQTQINSFYGVLFAAESEAAFANYRLWESMGFTIAYAYSFYLCTETKLIIVSCVLGAGIIGYFATEFILRYKDKTSYKMDGQNKDAMEKTDPVTGEDQANTFRQENKALEHDMVEIQHI